MEAALAWAVWNRVRLLGERFIALAARVRGGRLPVRRTPHPNPSPQGGREPGALARERAAAGLPREFGWIVRALPETAQYAGVLMYMLRDAEMAALVATAPQAARHLRPLCHLLGVETPEFLRRRRSIRATPPPLPVPEPGPGSGPGASLEPVRADTNGDAVASIADNSAEPADRLPTSEAGAQAGGVGAVAPPLPRRPLSWLEEDAPAMRERAARWVAGRVDAPSTLLPLGFGSGPSFLKNRP